MYREDSACGRYLQPYSAGGSSGATVCPQYCSSLHVYRTSRREEVALLDRKSSMLTTELHDVRVQSEIGEKARRAAEAEVRQASELIGQLTASNSTLTVAQKKLATEHQQITVSIYQGCSPKKEVRDA